MSRTERRLRRARAPAGRAESPRQRTPRRLGWGVLAVCLAVVIVILAHPERSGTARRIEGRTVAEWAGVLTAPVGQRAERVPERARAVAVLSGTLEAGTLGAATPRDADTDRAAMALARTVRDPDPTVAASAATALADLPALPASAVPDVVAAITVGRSATRVRALGLLMRVPPAARSETARQIARVAGDPDTAVQAAAVTTLARLLPQLAPTDQRLLLPVVLAVARGNSRGTTPGARATALGAFGTLAEVVRGAAPTDTAAGDSAWGLLAPAVRDSSADVRTAAVVAAGELLGVGAVAAPRTSGAMVAALRGALDDPDLDVRREAARALGAAGPAARSAVPALRAHAVDPSPGVQSAARDALARIRSALLTP